MKHFFGDDLLLNNPSSQMIYNHIKIFSLYFIFKLRFLLIFKNLSTTTLKNILKAKIYK